MILGALFGRPWGKTKQERDRGANRQQRETGQQRDTEVGRVAVCRWGPTRSRNSAADGATYMKAGRVGFAVGGGYGKARWMGRTRKAEFLGFCQNLISWHTHHTSFFFSTTSGFGHIFAVCFFIIFLSGRAKNRSLVVGPGFTFFSTETGFERKAGFEGKDIKFPAFGQLAVRKLKLVSSCKSWSSTAQVQNVS